MTKIRPLGARVLVEPQEAKEQMKGGIYIPDTAPKYGGTEVKIDDKEYQLVREEDLLGVIE